MRTEQEIREKRERYYKLLEGTSGLRQYDIIYFARASILDWVLEGEC